MVDYCLVIGLNDSIAEKVKKLLNEGWELHGGPFHTGNMIRVYEEDATGNQCPNSFLLGEIGQAVIRNKSK